MSHSIGFRPLVCIFLVITTGDAVHGQLAGSNAVALTNGQTMLDCLINTLAGSWWRRTTDGTNNVVPIASDCSVTGNNAAYYRAELLAGNICRLTIANATMQQAGVYNCFDGGLAIYRNLVTIIDPVASVVVYNQLAEVVENEQLNISCSINYTGPLSPAPSLRPSPYWTTSPGQIYNSTTYHPSSNVVTLVATVTVQKPTVPIFQCNTVFGIAGDTTNYNATAPADNFTVGNTTELHVQSWQTSTIPSIVSASIATITTTNDACRCDPIATTPCTLSDSCGVAIAAVIVGVILFISLAMNIIQLILLIRNQRAKHDPYRITQPVILDLSNEPSTPASYEELVRPTEIDLQPATYEQLTPKPPVYMNHFRET